MIDTPTRRLSGDDVLARVTSLPPLPEVWHQLDEALQREDTSPAVIVRLVSRDQALTAMALKLANSPFYRMSGRVVSLRDAVQVLGLQTLSAAALTAGVMASFDASACPGFDIAGSWRHAFGTAVCAQAMAEPRGMVPCTAYTAGLLHDIGTLALATSYPEAFNDTLRWAELHDVPPLEAERECLGIDHAVVGGMVARHWRLAPAVVDAVRHHHDMPDTAAASLADVVHLADSIVHALDVSHAADDAVPALSIASWARVSPTPGELEQLFQRVEVRLHQLDLVGAT